MGISSKSSTANLGRPFQSVAPRKCCITHAISCLFDAEISPGSIRPKAAARSIKATLTRRTRSSSIIDSAASRARSSVNRSAASPAMWCGGQGLRSARELCPRHWQTHPRAVGVPTRALLSGGRTWSGALSEHCAKQLLEKAAQFSCRRRLPAV